MQGPLYKEDRPMLSLQNAGAIQITRHIETAKTQYGCCRCCHAPDCCWCLICIPCCKLPRYVSDKLEQSKYAYIRENSVEWNDPMVTFEDCDYCIPVNYCKLRVQDNVKVIYFDDPMFEKIQNKSCGCLTNCLNWMFGGKGQKVRFSNMFCLCCVVGKTPAIPCCPVCCASCFGDILQQADVYVKDASAAAAEIKQAKANAKARMAF